MIRMLPFGVGILALAAAWAVFGKRRQNAPVTQKQFADMLDDFIEGRRGDSEWEAFCDGPVAEPSLAIIQSRLSLIDEEFPPDKAYQICSAAGLDILRRYRDDLRKAGPPNER